MSEPKRNVAYEFSTSLTDSATGALRVNPTIAAGDFKVSIDNGALVNLDTLPVVEPAGSIIVKINLSADEMNGDKIMVSCIDVAGAEWVDKLFFIDATDNNIDDILGGVLTESYAADGSEPTMVQALYSIMQMLTEKSVAGTVVTIKKLNGSDTAFTLTLNDGQTPTSITRTT